MRLERNWQLIGGVRKRTRGWTVAIGGLVIRYGVYYNWGALSGAGEVRLSVMWRPETPRAIGRPSELVYVVFPRLQVR